MRSVIAFQSWMLLKTSWRHSSLKRAMPYSSICCLLVKPKRFSTAISTGRPWVSQPPLRATRWPCMVLKRGKRSLNARLIT